MEILNVLDINPLQLTARLLVNALLADMKAIKSKKREGLNKLELAKEDLMLANQEANPDYALNRALTHLESSMQCFVATSDMRNSIIVGLYMSAIHKLLGNQSSCNGVFILSFQCAKSQEKSTLTNIALAA